MAKKFGPLSSFESVLDLSFRPVENLNSRNMNTNTVLEQQPGNDSINIHKKFRKNHSAISF